MKQIITTLVICFAITALNAGGLFANPILKHLKANIHDNSFYDRGKKALVVLPNPKTGDIQVSFQAEKAGRGTIVILNETGAAVLTQKVQLIVGKNNFNINDFNSLAEGDYTVCLNTNYGAFSSPFLLWK